MTVFDVVIVGAGSAGCVLADRLSAKGSSVCVIEAGPDLRPDTTPPSISGRSFFDALAEPGRIYPDLLARRVAGQPERPYLRGRGVGGSSAVNAMVGLWGEVDDYDAWERDHGCIGWAWRDVEKYFRRIEVPLTKVDPDDEGVVGRALVESCVLNGWPLHRGPFPLGGLSADVGPAMLTRDADGRRVTAADVYLERARSRPNVEVRCDAVVRRVTIEAGRATGVLLADGTLIDAREVVVCAGAIHSPAILLRSGVELPSLGAGLQDHPSAPVTLSVPRSTDTTGLAVSALARFSSGRHPADLQILPIDHLGPSAPGLASISVALMKVGSRGTVRLDPTDPDREPIVDFALLSDESDRESLTVGMGVLLDVLEHSSFTDVVEAAYIDDVGTPLASIASSPDAIRAWLGRATGDYVHAAGTCAMGDPTSEATVVDTRGRVVGMSGLRVCDASLMPSLPRANTHFPVMMIAEAIADRW